MKPLPLKHQTQFETCTQCNTCRPVEKLTDGKCNDTWCNKVLERNERP